MSHPKISPGIVVWPINQEQKLGSNSKTTWQQNWGCWWGGMGPFKIKLYLEGAVARHLQTL